MLRSRDAAEGRGVYGQRGYEPRQLHTSCEQGDPVACNDLGYLIESGTQMQPDPALAARYYEKACAGNAWAGCNNLGLFLRSTQQGAPDSARGLKLLRLACDAADLVACRNLGWLFLSKSSSTLSRGEGMRLFDRVMLMANGELGAAGDSADFEVAVAGALGDQQVPWRRRLLGQDKPQF